MIWYLCSFLDTDFWYPVVNQAAGCLNPHTFPPPHFDCHWEPPVSPLSLLHEKWWGRVKLWLLTQASVAQSVLSGVCGQINTVQMPSPPTPTSPLPISNTWPVSFLLNIVPHIVWVTVTLVLSGHRNTEKTHKIFYLLVTSRCLQKSSKDSLQRKQLKSTNSASWYMC